MKKFLLYFLAIFILIQFIRPTKNKSITDTNKNLALATPVSEDVQSILQRSCYDCHSNNTNYEWYHNIAPFSFAVAYHIKDGKEHINFDTWAKYNKDQKKHIIDDLQEAIETREMPLVGYLKFHPEAVLSDADNKKLLDWVNTLEAN